MNQNLLNTILSYIQNYSEENGYPPTVRDMCKDLHIKSTATAYSYVSRLKDMGLLNNERNKKRAVSITSDCVKIPLIGTVTAGIPIFAAENYEGYYSIPIRKSKGDELFLLNVQGRSMIEAGILDKDKIVVKKQSTAENGDIVVALIDDSATVKRFFKKDGKIVLHPENPEYSDIILDDVVILGKVIGLLRTDM